MASSCSRLFFGRGILLLLYYLLVRVGGRSDSRGDRRGDGRGGSRRRLWILWCRILLGLLCGMPFQKRRMGGGGMGGVLYVVEGEEGKKQGGEEKGCCVWCDSLRWVDEWI